MNKIKYESINEVDFCEKNVTFTENKYQIEDVVKAYREYGVAVINPSQENNASQEAFNDFYKKFINREIDKFNGVNFCIEEKTPKEIISVEKNSDILSIVSKLLKEYESHQVTPSILNSKFLLKDSKFNDRVFLHQDSCYQLGRNKVTVFYPLCDLDSDELRESSIRVLVGTHKFGHLGDAGEINNNILEENWPSFLMAVKKHSYILMDPSCWHYSNQCEINGKPRAIYTFTYVNKSAVSLRLPGSHENLEKNLLNTNQLFIKSRVSRLKYLQDFFDKTNGVVA